MNDDLPTGNGAPIAPSFVVAAANGLAVAGNQLAGARQAVASGAVRLDQDAAAALLSALDELTTRAANLISFTEQGMDQRLHLGQNWIGTIMDQRLRGAVDGRPDSLRPVLIEFHAMFADVADTVRRAAGLTDRTDQESADLLNGAAR